MKINNKNIVFVLFLFISSATVFCDIHIFCAERMKKGNFNVISYKLSNQNKYTINA